jgi:small ligand-binding sensory domain FIST
VKFLARHLTDHELPDADDPPGAWVERLDLEPESARGVLVMSDPFSLSSERLIAGLDYAWPGVPKVGGLASGGVGAAGQFVFANDTAHRLGAVVLGIEGDMVVDALVAQGCRPIGAVGRITQCEENYLIAVDGKPALEFLRMQLEQLDAPDRELARRSPLFLGIAMDPFTLDHPGPGDFLVRNILGYDPSSGMMAIGEKLGTGRRVQFHLRDAETSRQDLEAVLARATNDPPARGALMFACLGRGEHLYGRPGFDSELFAARFQDVPLGGFFCNGEIGPVGGTTYLHGYTSSFALLREPSA